MYKPRGQNTRAGSNYVRSGSLRECTEDFRASTLEPLISDCLHFLGIFLALLAMPILRGNTQTSCHAHPKSRSNHTRGCTVRSLTMQSTKNASSGRWPRESSPSLPRTVGLYEGAAFGGFGPLASLTNCGRIPWWSVQGGEKRTDVARSRRFIYA